MNRRVLPFKSWSVPRPGKAGSVERKKYKIEEFDSVLFPFLKSTGYVSYPTDSSWTWVFLKGRFVLSLAYDPRENYSIKFGQIRDIEVNDFEMAEVLRNHVDYFPYSALMEKLGEDGSALTDAYGGWREGGLQFPNFTLISSEVIRTLPMVEKSFCIVEKSTLFSHFKSILRKLSSTRNLLRATLVIMRYFNRR